MKDQDSSIAGAGLMQGESHWRWALGGGGTLRGFRRRGSGALTGVFIHGFRSHCDGEKSRYLSETAGRLGFDWLRFDQRGCGSSSGESRRFTLSGAVGDVHEALEALGDPACLLVGSSLGALLAIHVAASGRRRVKGLVLIAPALRFTRRFIHDQIDERDLERWRRRGYRWFPDLYAGGCFRLDYVFCQDALRYAEPPGKLPCPVRVIHGNRDEVLPLRDTTDWLARLDCPGQGLEIIDGGDHRLTGWSHVIARQTGTFWNEVSKPCD